MCQFIHGISSSLEERRGVKGLIEEFQDLWLFDKKKKRKTSGYRHNLLIILYLSSFKGTERDGIELIMKPHIRSISKTFHFRPSL